MRVAASVTALGHALIRGLYLAVNRKDLQAVADFLTGKRAVAQELHVSPGTALAHVDRGFRKLGASRAEGTLKATQSSIARGDLHRIAQDGNGRENANVRSISSTPPNQPASRASSRVSHSPCSLPSGMSTSASRSRTNARHLPEVAERSGATR